MIILVIYTPLLSIVPPPRLCYLKKLYNYFFKSFIHLFSHQKYFISFRTFSWQVVTVLFRIPGAGCALCLKAASFVLQSFWSASTAGYQVMNLANIQETVSGAGALSGGAVFTEIVGRKVWWDNRSWNGIWESTTWFKVSFYAGGWSQGPDSLLWLKVLFYGVFYTDCC